MATLVQLHRFAFITLAGYLVTADSLVSRVVHPELYTLLLEDILVLLQKQDERLILKCQSKNLVGTADTKHIFSPVIKLNTVLVRSVATGESHNPSPSCNRLTSRSVTLSLLSPPPPPDNKSFFVLCMLDDGAQIYELMAPTVSDQRT